MKETTASHSITYFLKNTKSTQIALHCFKHEQSNNGPPLENQITKKKENTMQNTKTKIIKNR